MILAPVPTQSNVMTALGNFLVAVLPAGTDVAVAQTNRVPEPSADNFVVMTPLRQDRIETNVDAFDDMAFTGSISGANMTVAAIDPRFADSAIQLGRTIFGVGVAPGTRILSQTSGAPGGPGVYVVSVAQAVASGTISAGAQSVTQAVRHAVQLDFHSKDLTVGADMAVTVSTLLRDEFATDQFANQSPSYDVTPLYADDARQVPFTNDQKQVEWRWVVEALLQANVVVSVPMQFADSVGVELISVDAEYAP